MLFTSLLSIVLAFATPCQTEDSTNCTWNDGTGTSFVSVDDVNYYSDGSIIDFN